MLSSSHQVGRFFVDFNHRDRITGSIEHRDVVFDEKTFRWSRKLLLFALRHDIVVGGENTAFRRERFIELVVLIHFGPNQSRVA